MRGLHGRRVIVTGGASGIGRAAALRLAAEGCVLGIFDLDEAGAQIVARQSEQAAAYRVDITDREQIAAAVASFEATFGPVEGLANVAGWDTPVPFLETDRALWDKVIQINLYGPLNMHHVVARGMAERGFGRVVNVASDAGRVGSSGEAVYSACKGGHDRVHQDDGARAGAQGRDAERGVPRAHRHAAVRELPRRLAADR